MIVALLDSKRAPDDWYVRAEALAPFVDALILRAKEEPAVRQWELARRAAVLSCPVLMADRADVARAAGLAGVHLPEDGLPPASIRTWWPDALVSRSIHAPPDRDAVAGADWLIFGHLFDTRSKPGLAPRGPEAARAAVRAAAVPVLGIGGVTPERVVLLTGSGLLGIVAADALFLAEDPGAAARALRDAWQSVAGQGPRKEKP